MTEALANRNGDVTRYADWTSDLLQRPRLRYAAVW